MPTRPIDFGRGLSMREDAGFLSYAPFLIFRSSESAVCTLIVDIGTIF